MRVCFSTLLVGISMTTVDAAEPSTRPIPVILDTDIGTDVDDAFALALLLTSPEFDVRGVTTVGGDAHTRAMIACRFLDAVARNGIPVAAGRLPRSKPTLEGQFQYGLRAADKRPVKPLAKEFLYETLKASPGEITLITIGDLTNVAELLEAHPEAKPWIKRIVLMGGSVHVGYSGKPPIDREWNIRADVAAARKVFASGVPLVVAPLDATTMVKLNEPLRSRILGTDTPICRQVNALYELWPQEVPTMYDPVAVAIAAGEKSFLEFEDLRLEVDDEGYTRIVDGATNARVATRIDVDEFLKWYAERVTRSSLPATFPDTIDIRIDGPAKAERLGILGTSAAFDEFRAMFAEVDRKEEKSRTVSIRAESEVPCGTVTRVIAFCQGLGFETFEFAHTPLRFANPAKLVERGGLPRRVHVFEDFETEIERRWWLAGLPETKDVPDGSKRAMRAVPCRDFDRKMGDRYWTGRAVIFNPVPGPPMGPNTRLSFRYKLKAGSSNRLRVQIFSLSKGYHRHLTLHDLPTDEWREATVDMTAMRRPDGSGGPLAEDERIDDIQFNVDHDTELLIDDIVLYDAGAEDEKQPFPRRFLFTGWFDTGTQGREWPGDFEIDLHEKPRSGDYARSVTNDDDRPHVRVGLRGQRPLHVHADERMVEVRCECWSSTKQTLRFRASDSASGLGFAFEQQVPAKEWTTLTHRFDTTAEDGPASLDQLVFLGQKETEIRIDDVLLYVPGAVTPSE